MEHVTHLILMVTISNFLAASNIQLMHASSVGEVSVSLNDKAFLKNVNYLLIFCPKGKIN